MRGLVTTVSVSAESGVQRVVTEVVKKRLDLAEIVRAAESARAAGVPLMVHYIIGLPGESAEEINGTLRFAMDLYERPRRLARGAVRDAAARAPASRAAARCPWWTTGARASRPRRASPG
jgi:hypothetical protein